MTLIGCGNTARYERTQRRDSRRGVEWATNAQEWEINSHHVTVVPGFVLFFGAEHKIKCCQPTSSLCGLEMSWWPALKRRYYMAHNAGLTDSFLSRWIENLKTSLITMPHCSVSKSQIITSNFTYVILSLHAIWFYYMQIWDACFPLVKLS